MALPPFTCSIEYLGKAFNAESVALGGALDSEGMKRLDLHQLSDWDKLKVLKDMKHPLTGEKFGNLLSQSLLWLYSFILSASASVNAYFSKLTPEQFRELHAKTFRVAVQAAMRVMEQAIRARYKQAGKSLSEPAEGMGLAVFHALARPYGGEPGQVNLHAHFLWRQVAVMKNGRVVSILNAMALAWVMPQVVEAFNRVLADTLRENGVDAEYVKGRAEVRGLDPEYVKAVTGNRQRQIRAWLKRNKKSPKSPKWRRIAAAKTAAPKPAWQRPADFEFALARTLEVGRAVAAEIAARKDASDKAFAEYAYGPTSASYEARRPHIEAAVARKSNPSYRVEKRDKTAQRWARVDDAALFLEQTRRWTVPEAAKIAWRKTRRENLDADWGGVQTLGRIAATFAKHFLEARKRAVGPLPGTTLFVPEKQWKFLHQTGQLAKLYARAEEHGWQLQMENMPKPDHERRVRNAVKAVANGINERHQFEGYTPN
jgi:hypothetical protein